MQIRLLLRVSLPQPVLDRNAVLELIRYQQRHKQAAYASHRWRRVLTALRPFLPATIPRVSCAAPVLNPSHLVRMLASHQGGSLSL